MLVPNYFCNGHSVKLVQVGFTSPKTQVAWLSWHSLLPEQEKAILKLDGPSLVHWVSGFRAKSFNDFLHHLEFSIDLFNQVYVVGPSDWLRQATKAGLSFREFKCYHSYSSNLTIFKCVYQYQSNIRKNILGAHEIP